MTSVWMRVASSTLTWKGFSPVWTSWWRFSLELSTNALPHSAQTCTRGPWVWRCFLMAELSLNILVQPWGGGRREGVGREHMREWDSESHTPGQTHGDAYKVNSNLIWLIKHKWSFSSATGCSWCKHWLPAGAPVLHSYISLPLLQNKKANAGCSLCEGRLSSAERRLPSLSWASF